MTKVHTIKEGIFTRRTTGHIFKMKFISSGITLICKEMKENPHNSAFRRSNLRENRRAISRNMNPIPPPVIFPENWQIYTSGKSLIRKLFKEKATSLELDRLTK
jgi:hypothetical protein